MKYFSTFSGVGCAEVTLDQLGHECVGYSEIDRYCSWVYRYHFPSHKAYGDITAINVSGVPDHDLLVGGFPCQSFSIAGKRRGFQDTRGTLFFYLAEIARVKRPRYLLFENVKGLLTHDGGDTYATILATLSELGYDCQWQVLNGKYWVPQNRERIFIVGHRRGEPRPQIFPLGESDCWDTESQEEAQGEGARVRSDHSRPYTSTLRVGGGQTSDLIAHNLQPRNPDRPSLKKGEYTAGSGHLQREDGIAYCLDTKANQAIEFPQQKTVAIQRAHGHFPGSVSDIAPTLRGSSHKGNLAIASTLAARDYKGGGNLIFKGGVGEPNRLQDGKENSRNFKQGYRVYSDEGIASALPAQGVGGPGGMTGLYEIKPKVKALTEARTEESKEIRRKNLKEGRDWSPRRGKELVEREDELANTLTTGQTKESMVTDGHSHIRRLTPKECERLTGLPDEWTRWGINNKDAKVEISDSQRYKMCGNAIIVPLIGEIIKKLTEHHHDLGLQ